MPSCRFMNFFFFFFFKLPVGFSLFVFQSVHAVVSYSSNRPFNFYFFLEYFINIQTTRVLQTLRPAGCFRVFCFLSKKNNFFFLKSKVCKVQNVALRDSLGLIKLQNGQNGTMHN